MRIECSKQRLVWETNSLYSFLCVSIVFLGYLKCNSRVLQGNLMLFKSLLQGQFQIVFEVFQGGFHGDFTLLKVWKAGVKNVKKCERIRF